MKFSTPLLLLLCCFYLISCSKDDNTASAIETSTDLIEFEAEGGQEQITVSGTTDWQIANVINENGNNIRGDIFSSDRELLSANAPINLENMGYIEALNEERGFTIIRDSQNYLNIALMENFSGDSFKFIIVLQSGETFKEIEVIQKKSEGYRFDSIEYELKEEDRDSIFTKKGTTIKLDLQQPQTFSFSPFSGIDITNNSRFESDQADAFVWLENDSLRVKVPTSIDEEQIYFDGQQRVYSDQQSINTHGFEIQENIDLPEGESEFWAEIEYRQRIVTYILTLINNRTGDEKLIEGKWIEVAPTGEYTIHWED